MTLVSSYGRLISCSKSTSSEDFKTRLVSASLHGGSYLLIIESTNKLASSMEVLPKATTASNFTTEWSIGISRPDNCTLNILASLIVKTAEILLVITCRGIRLRTLI
eukprot:NODE_413_length_9103_cov_0.450911.p6 type:complete len:107 gc:universal NODE_413_length_9103_cov_0.450911:6535-6855(+)